MSSVGRIEGPSFLDDARLRRLFDALDGDGEEMRVVGGAVRNHLMHVPVHEVDLATTATPTQTMARAKAAGLKSVPTGIEHGTVTTIVDHMPFEITTLREDVETDGRRAIVAFGRDFEADAMRRDFTFNALSVRADGTLFDYANGLADIERRHVRFIGDPDARIREDYLRILRFFRFHAAFGEGEADPQALRAIGLNRAGLDGLSRERVRAECLKLLEARNAAPVIGQMSGLGLMLPILGGVAMPARLARIVAIEAVRGAKPDALLRLGALAILKREDALRLRERLRLSNAECKRLAEGADTRAKWHARPMPPDAQTILTWLFLDGCTATCDALDLGHAECSAPPDDAAWQSARRFAAETPVPRLPIGGADLLARGIPAGKAVGEALKAVQQSWIAAGFPERPEALAPMIAAALASKTSD